MASRMRVADRCNSGDDRRPHCIGNSRKASAGHREEPDRSDVTVNTSIIETEVDYRAALKEIAALMDADPAPGTPDGDRLDIIVTLVQAYECQHHPIAASKPMQG